MKVYIAGPMTGIKHLNFPAFDKARDRLKAAGHIPISPADISRLFEGWGCDGYPPNTFEADNADIRRFMKHDLAVVEDVKALFMLIGWEQSRGARLERAYADFLGLEIWYEK